MPSRTVHVIGAGPAGLMAAERLAQAGATVVVHERMPSVARKMLMAGRGGLNLTHSEPLDRFMTRYGSAQPTAAAWIDRFTPADLTAWVEALGQETYVGSSGRVFPKAMKTSPLLRSWLARPSSRFWIEMDPITRGGSPTVGRPLRSRARIGPTMGARLVLVLRGGTAGISRSLPRGRARVNALMAVIPCLL